MRSTRELRTPFSPIIVLPALTLGLGLLSGACVLGEYTLLEGSGGSGGAGGGTTSTTSQGGTGGTTANGGAPAGGGGSGGSGGCVGCIDVVVTWKGQGSNGCNAIAVESEKSIFVGGYVQGSVTFGSQTSPSQGGRDGFLAHVDERGDPAFVKLFSAELNMPEAPASDQEVRAMARLADGSLVIGGSFESGIYANTADVYTAVGMEDGFVFRVTNTADPGWSKPLGGTQRDVVTGIAPADAQGAVLAIGEFEGTAELPVGSQIAQGFSDVFVARYATVGGNPDLQSIFASDAIDHASGIAADKQGGFSIVGDYGNNLDVTNGMSLSNTSGTTDAFIVHLDENLVPNWTGQLTGTLADPNGKQSAHAVATDESGNVYVVGDFEQEVVAQPGGVTLPNDDEEPDLFLWKLNVRGGATQWLKAIPNIQLVPPLTMAADPKGGGVVLAGAFTGTANFGQGDVTSPDGGQTTGLFLVRFDESGELLWQKIVTGSGEKQAGAVAFAADDSVFLCGSFSKTADFGDGPIMTMSFADTDLFLLRVRL